MKKPKFEVGDTVKLGPNPAGGVAWKEVWNNRYARITEVENDLGNGWVCKVSINTGIHTRWHEAHLERAYNGLQLAVIKAKA